MKSLSILCSENKAALLRLAEECNVEGEYWECGVYKGGTAAYLAEFNRTLRLFDSFEGMKTSTPGKDNYHRAGNFSDCNFPEIQKYFMNMNHVHIHKGWIPETFVGLENSVIAFAHIDVDLYQSYLDCLNFIYPRMPSGGIIVFDDIYHPCCRGATEAVEEFLSDKPEKVKRDLHLPIVGGYLLKE